MYRIILKILSPYLLRYFANKVVDYLNQQREQRLQPAREKVAAKTDAAKETIADTVSSSASQPIWFVLAGVVIGTGLGFIAAYLLNRDA